MDLLPNELKEIWTRTDEYFQFRYEQYSTFGARLKKWRELNDVSQIEMAEAIYNYRKYMGLENDDISDEVLKSEYEGNERYKLANTETVIKREQKKERRITSLMRTYHKWESNETDAVLADTPFSMAHLRILKKILECDYEFLFCEINTPHKHTDEMAEQTGLKTSTIEKLFSYDKSYMQDKEPTSSAFYAHGIITALDKLISDDDLMTYLSWYLTNTDTSADEFDEEDEEQSDTITIVRPVAGIATEDAYMDGTVNVLDSDAVHQVYMITIAAKLARLREKKTAEKPFYPSDLPSFNRIVLANEDDSFGERLRKWREYKHYTQDKVAELIFNFRKDHNLQKTVNGKPYLPEKGSIIRTYQNWEKKSNADNDPRISMTDLFILKSIIGCDYEYLFGEINTLNTPEHTIYQSIGLSHENIDKLKLYAKSLQEKVEGVPAYASNILSTIDLIVSDNDLLSNLAFYLSEMPFYPNMRLCSILKPRKAMGIPFPPHDAYANYLFPEDSELRNVFLPAMFSNLLKLRKRKLYNHQP